jgi:DNA-binding transcriptional ArsR family regulator
VTKDPKQRLADTDAVFAALDHPARRQIVMTVHFWGGSMTAGEIAGRFGHAWPTTTRHLHVLTKARLLSVERVGRTRIYRLNRARLKVVADWLGWFESTAAKPRTQAS